MGRTERGIETQELAPAPTPQLVLSSARKTLLAAMSRSTRYASPITMPPASAKRDSAWRISIQAASPYRARLPEIRRALCEKPQTACLATRKARQAVSTSTTGPIRPKGANGSGREDASFPFKIPAGYPALSTSDRIRAQIDPTSTPHAWSEVSLRATNRIVIARPAAASDGRVRSMAAIAGGPMA